MMESQYDPKKIEGKIYDFWNNGGYFQPAILKQNNGKKYSIVIPPPNITGTLHMGHALNALEQDILIRFKRMSGFKTLWLPGIDHAGIATQNVVEKDLRKQEISRHDLGREKFIEKVWEWKEKYGNIILNQYKSFGASCDWSRLRFTLDEKYAQAVLEAFVQYYNRGLVYRGKRVVNWCVRCQTSISDLEVEMEETAGKLWHIKYPLAENNEKFIVVATTRPETMLGDVAVAVNPKDARYKNLIGKKLKLPLTDREIPVISDLEIDQEFGTGAVKVTPSHDFVDQKIGQKHKLPGLEIIDTFGKLNKNVPPQYQGLKVIQAREKIVEDLKNLNLLEKITDHAHNVPHCERCHSIIEPLQSEQWFIKMSEVVKPALESLKKNEIKFHPENWQKLMVSWMENIQDWCISRQLWWGHRMPIYQCQSSHEYFVSRTIPDVCPKCHKCSPKQSEDVFDTWFSSALWPFATLGWPEATDDLSNFYPTDVILTAREIFNLWIARMIFSGLEFKKQIPFKNVIIHATILTKDGKRMSKSLGTGIDPLILCDKYGTDATRMGIAWQITDLQDIRFGEDNIIAGKKFANKVWNATRFVLMDLPADKKFNTQNEPVAKTKADERILSGLKDLIEKISDDIENYRFGSYIRQVYEFFWHEFCDIYIEESKKQNTADNSLISNTQQVLMYVLEKLILILHPCMPFITEEIYQILPLENKTSALIIAPWPINNVKPQVMLSLSDLKPKSISKPSVKKKVSKPAKATKVAKSAKKTAKKPKNKPAKNGKKRKK